MKIAVYTAIVGGKDFINKSFNKFPGAKYILYTDKQLTEISAWDIIKPCHDFSNNDFKHRRSAKMPKILSCLHNQDYDYTIWMDGTHECLINPKEIIEKFLIKPNKLWASFNHPSRSCIYKEAEALRSLGWIDTLEKINLQTDRYRADKYPENNGLLANTVLVRKNCERVAELESMWWEEICRGSSRDQLSLNYCMHKLKFREFTIMDGHWQRNNYVALKQSHAKITL